MYMLLGGNNNKKLGLYDFTFGAWPVDYKWDESKADRNMRRGSENTTSHRQTFWIFVPPWILAMWTFLGILLAHSVGRPMIYPGSTGLLQSGFGEALLTEDNSCLNNGKRAKLEAADGIELDTMFMDKRISEDDKSKGNTLVITCEGNAGFYEVGLMTTPLKAGEIVTVSPVSALSKSMFTNERE
ncbi:Protein abhd16a [Desmophyllum pertusum]|uniref:Protein abhd16a n=1 Tax=Desmophyllum pertusum TaxID=174260 RepID=A0A9W9YTT0_9CNID|nr:Protein abhd16a [Desmophyllum pertusum]